MPATVRDVASRANVSKSTVGYVLSGHPKRVSEEIRTRVLDAARELGYRPNENARSLARGRTDVIGVVPFQLQHGAMDSPFMWASMIALYDRAEERNRHILLFTGYDAADPAAVRARSFESRVDGIVLVAPQIGHEMLSFLEEIHIPVALVSSPVSGSILHFNVDNAEGVGRAVDHLVGLGHRRVAFIGGPRGDGTSDERRDAFLACMARANLPVPEASLCFGEFTRPSGRECALTLLSGEARPTAIVAGNDRTAYGVYDAARELGLEIPRDLSVVGFDDEPEAELVYPPLTTVAQPVAEMARAALDAVIAHSEGEEAASRTFPTRLVVRASTASPTEG